ncbi:MAG: hypothetical protein AAB425_15085 [Bdellovibrionota bacterium]
MSKKSAPSSSASKSAKSSGSAKAGAPGLKKGAGKDSATGDAPEMDAAQALLDREEREEQEEAAEAASSSSSSSGGGAAAAAAAAAGSTEMSASFKNFRHHPDMENFYRFIFENDLRHEAKAILDTMLAERQIKKQVKVAKSKSH